MIMMKCYNVKCVDENSNFYDVGVMTTDARRAMDSAEKSLLEGRHINAKAVDVNEVEFI